MINGEVVKFNFDVVADLFFWYFLYVDLVPIQKVKRGFVCLLCRFNDYECHDQHFLLTTFDTLLIF